MNDLDDITGQYPGWYIWQGLVNGLWHARRKGGGPVVLLHDNSPRELAEQIRAYQPLPQRAPSVPG